MCLDRVEVPLTDLLCTMQRNDRLFVGFPQRACATYTNSCCAVNNRVLVAVYTADDNLASCTELCTNYFDSRVN